MMDMERGFSGLGAGGAVVMLAGLLVVSVSASEPPLLRPEDRVLLERQAEELASAGAEATRAKAGSVVWVWSGGKQVALGTVIGDGSRVLTKWSELGEGGRRVRCVTGGGRTIPSRVVGVYQADDLAVIRLDGEKLVPVKWSAEPAPRPGRFLLAALPDGKPAAFGVVGVEERSLREVDKAFLGIRRDLDYQGRGVRVLSVEGGSGAEVAGVRAGDVVLRVGERRVSGYEELRATLADLDPGAKTKLRVSRKGVESEVEVELGRRRPEFRQMPAMRLRAMEEMAGPNGTSRVGDGFPDVIQSDMKIPPGLCGSPVVDLNGEVIGITIARATRTRSFVIPVSRLREVLAEVAIDPAVTRIESEGVAQSPRNGVNSMRPRPRPGGRPQRERVEELGKLLELFLEEMSEE